MSRPTHTPDPLADLREPEPAPGLPVPAQAPSAAPVAPVDPDAAPGAPEAVLDVLWHDTAARAIVDRWHGDDVARQQMHGGGTCGCRYAATLALLAVHGTPVLAPEVEDVPTGDTP